MIQKIKISTGEEVWAKEIEFTIGAEPWAEYRIKGGEMDGRELRVRLFLLRAWVLCDERGTPLLAPDGTPQVQVTFDTRVLTK